MDEASFAEVVEAQYRPLYRFALSLTHREADACDLTQEAFRRLAAGGGLRDPSKVKSWLFTTVHRLFLTSWRWQARFPHCDLSIVGSELPATGSTVGDDLDGAAARAALQKVDEVYRVALILFYLEEHSYLEIAKILGIPAGTVMSRISRGRAMLRRIVAGKPDASQASESALVV